MQGRVIRSMGLALIFALLTAGCATRQPAAAGTPAAQPAAPATGAAADEKPVTWDPAVLAAFQKEVPRFVQALAKERIEEMARENGSYYVDQALYEKAMAEYRK